MATVNNGGLVGAAFSVIGQTITDQINQQDANDDVKIGLPANKTYSIYQVGTSGKLQAQIGGSSDGSNASLQVGEGPNSAQARIVAYGNNALGSQNAVAFEASNSAKPSPVIGTLSAVYNSGTGLAYAAVGSRSNDQLRLVKGNRIGAILDGDATNTSFTVTEPNLTRSMACSLSQNGSINTFSSNAPALRFNVGSSVGNITMFDTGLLSLSNDNSRRILLQPSTTQTAGSTVTLTLPPNMGSSGQSLITNGVDSTSWRFNAFWYNVRDYGAVGDNVTDDSTAIQAAITAASATGGIVYFPRSTYFIGTSTISLSSVNNVMLVGDGRRASVLRRGTGTNTLVNFVSSTGGGVRDLGIDANNTGSLTLRFENATQALVTNVRLINSSTTTGCLTITASGGTKCNYLSFSNVDMVLATNANGIIINSADVEYISFDTVNITGGVLQLNMSQGTNIAFRNMTCSANTANHSIAVSGGTNIGFTECRVLFASGGSGFSLSNIVNLSIRNCLITNTYGSGVSLSTCNKALVTECVFQDNNTLGSGSLGHLRFLTSSDCIVSNNRFIRVNTASINHIVIDSASSNILINGNYLPSADVTNVFNISGTPTRTIFGNTYSNRSYLSESTAGVLTLNSATNNVSISPTTATSNYTLSLPTGLPSATNAVTCSSTGQLAFAPFTPIYRGVSNVIASTTNAALTRLASVTVPANSIGPNGYLQVTFAFDRTNTTNDVNFTVIASSNNNNDTTGTIIFGSTTAPEGHTLTGTENAYGLSDLIVRGNGTNTTSVIYNRRATGYSGHINAFETATISTASDWYLKFCAGSTNAATTVQLEHYSFFTVFAA